MIASPGDVSAERQIVTEELQRWNDANAYARKLVLSPLKWETHSTPQLGKPAQAIINGQLLDSADILIGIFGTRIGTPTEEFVSGTVEEIKRHVAAGKTVKVYFSDTPVAPSTIDRAQYEAVQVFRDECRSLGLYATYSDLNQFRNDFKHHLDLELNQARYLWLSTLSPVLKEEEQSISSEAMKLLVAAASSQGGMIMHMKSIGSEGIHAGTEHFMDGTARSNALWRDALTELRSRGFIEESRAGSGNYTLTKSGFQTVDAFSKAEEERTPLSLQAEVIGPVGGQEIAIKSNRAIRVSAFEFLTSTDACISRQPMDLEGKEIAAKLDHSKLVELNNSPRPDRNNYDSSGPAKVRIVFTVHEKQMSIVVPVMLAPQTWNSARWITLTGSGTFKPE